ncbi:MAG: extracellular solute-binding protein [Gammaproteobacteria bacterium]|nr:extracellular solute-binding protein [Gammaproteobacteria bacterium]MDH5769970.1 extracellular solute-binding protein [Candidatus Bathyarchaeota archaeon]
MKREIGQGTVTVVIVAIIAAIVGAAAVYFLMPAPAEEEEKPNVVRVIAVAGPETDVLAKYAVEDFEAETGYTASIEIVSRGLWGGRVVNELIEDAGIYDVVMIGGGDDLQWVKSKGHTIPLETYLTEAEMNKIHGKEWWTNVDGELVGVPQYINFPMLFYRKDLLEDPAEKAAFEAEYGYELKPPTNYDELYDVAEFFHRPPDMYGFFLGGCDWSVNCDHTYYMYGTGSNYGDVATGDLTLNTTEAKSAMAALTRMADFNPPGWETMSFFDGDQYMLEGKVFMYQNWFYIWATFCDQMPDQVGVAAVTGDAQPGAHLGAFVAVIPEAAPNPDAGGAFIKWMISNDYQKKQSIETGNLPMRTDTMEDSEVKAAIKDYEIFKAVMPYLTFRHCTWPGELQSGLYEAISKVWDGTMTAEEACDWLQNTKFAGRAAIE